MLISQTSEYALRAMAWLASVPPERLVRARDLSEGAEIPLHYLSKILRRLVLADLLLSQKGQGGGFMLARPAGEIRFLDVLAAMDNYLSPGRCAFGWGTCDESNPCMLHESWSELNETLLRWATGNTLADVQSKATESVWSGRPGASASGRRDEV